MCSFHLVQAHETDTIPGQVTYEAMWIGVVIGRWGASSVGEGIRIWEKVYLEKR